MKRATLLFALVLGLVGYTIECSAQSVRRAQRALRSGDIEAAMEQVRGVLENDPDSYRAYEVLAQIHEAMAEVSPTEEYVSHISQMKSAYDSVIVHRPREENEIMLKMRQRWGEEFTMGIAEFNNAHAAAEDSAQIYYFKSAAHFEASAVVMPDSVGSYINWGYALLGAGENVKAIEPLQLALDYGGPDAEVFSRLARTMLTNERIDDAVTLLERAKRDLPDFPENVELQNLLLNAYAMAGKTDRALATYEQAVAEHPENKTYRYNYGSLLLQEEQFEGAVEHLEAAVRLDSNYVDALYNLGAAYINMANAIQARYRDIDDRLRAEKDSLSDEDQAAMEADMELLDKEKISLYDKALEPLEKAKRLAEEQASESVQQICSALYQAYAQLNQMDMIEAVSVCAGV